MTGSAALSCLLLRVSNDLERAYAAEGVGGPCMPSLDLWANLLRAVDENGTSLRELPALVRLSKRAVKSRVAEASRSGWTERLRLYPRDVIVRPTARGSEIAARWKSLQEAAEKRWRASVRPEPANALRASIEAIVSRFPLEHPHYPAGYGAADARITGGNGRDWKAVPRESGDTVSSLSLSALLSQAWVAFAMEYENRSPVALSLSSEVIKRIPAEGRPLHELGHSLGVSALVRHGFVRLSRSRGSETATLTPTGFSVSEAYDRRLREVEAEWCARFGKQSVTALRQALEGITGDITC